MSSSNGAGLANPAGTAIQRLELNNPVLVIDPAGVLSFDFDDIKPFAVHVNYRREKFVMVEASAAVAIAFRNSAIRSARLNDGKVVGLDGAADGDAVLLGSCLCRADENYVPREHDKQGNPVGVGAAFVRSMPNRVTEPLVLRLKEMSALNDEDTVESLEKRIKSDTEKLAKLKAQQPAAAPAADPLPKDGPPATTPNSD